MEIFENLETALVLFALVDPLLFASFLELVAKNVFSFADHYIMKKIDATIDAFVPLLHYFFQFYITKTGLKLGFVRVFGANDKPQVSNLVQKVENMSTSATALGTSSPTSTGQADLQPVSSSSSSVVQATPVVSLITQNTVKTLN